MKTSLAERAKARRGEEDRRKRDAGELLRLRARVRELEMLCAEVNQKARALGPDEGYAVPLYLIERCEAAVEKLRVRLHRKGDVSATRGQAIEPTKGEL